jgi:hypothetical protein
MTDEKLFDRDEFPYLDEDELEEKCKQGDFDFIKKYTKYRSLSPIFLGYALRGASQHSNMFDYLVKLYPKTAGIIIDNSTKIKDKPLIIKVDHDTESKKPKPGITDFSDPDSCHIESGTGEYTLRNKKKIVMLIRRVKNHRLHGIQEGFYSNGSKMYIHNYVDGVQQGEQKWFYSDGSLLYLHMYVDGHKHGKQKSWISDPSEEKVSLVEEVYEHGLKYVPITNGKYKGKHYLIFIADNIKSKIILNKKLTYKQGNKLSGEIIKYICVIERSLVERKTITEEEKKEALEIIANTTNRELTEREMLFANEYKLKPPVKISVE